LYGIPENKIKVVYSGFPTPYKGGGAEEKPQIDSSQFSISTNKYILFLGTVERRKNVQGLIDAFRVLNEKYKITDYDLVISGGRGYGGRKIETNIRNLKPEIRNKIKIIGYVEEEDKKELYGRASLFVYPSFYEGFGFPPLEAMANGCPVVTSNSASLPEIAGGASLMVDPYNINEIASAMAQILRDSQMRDSLIAKGFGMVKRFNWEECARKTLEVLESV